MHLILTKLSSVPYYISFIFFLAFFLESIIDQIALEKGFKMEQNFKLESHLLFKKEILHCCRFATLIAFIYFRLYEMILLNAFMKFQDKLRVENLEVNKEEFNTKERNITNCMKGAVSFCIAIFVLVGVLRTLYEFFDADGSRYLDLIYLIIIFLLLFLGGLFLFFFTLSVLIVMYRRHRLAYEQHSRQIIIMLVLTLTTLFCDIIWVLIKI